MSEGIISIHALREEGDRHPSPGGSPWPDFNPRPPRGGRPEELRANAGEFVFQSTPSARRATAHDADDKAVLLISIHALREEGDGLASSSALGLSHFNPRPPRGGRRGYGRQLVK